MRMIKKYERELEKMIFFGKEEGKNEQGRRERTADRRDVEGEVKAARGKKVNVGGKSRGREEE